MPKLQTQCPTCRQPLVADVMQVFDVGQDPRAKEVFLSGMFNFAQCATCGFQGQIPMPLVYHDPEKELLLTFVPPSAGGSMQERENMLAPLMRKVTENLPPEGTKGYLFQPKSMFTVKNMLETVLEADGITKEMMEAQEKKMSLIQRLLSVSEETQIEVIHQEEDLIDNEFFSMFSQLAQMAMQGGSEADMEKLRILQENLIDETEFGRKLKEEAEAIQEARASLEKLGQGLTREHLLKLVVEAPDMARVKALTSLARPGMDYAFFQMLTEQIEKTSGAAREQLIERRNTILRLVEEIDEITKQRAELAEQNLEALLKAEDVPQALKANINAVDDFFVGALEQALSAAQEADDADDNERLEKLMQIMAVIQELSAPPELAVIEKFIEQVDDEGKLDEVIAAHGEEITPELIDYMTRFLGSAEESLDRLSEEQKAQHMKFQEELLKVYQAVLRFSMKREMGA